MPLGDLIIPPLRPDLLNLFAFANQDHHRLINTAIFKQFNQTLAEYVLDPMPSRDIDEWLDLHQRMHAAQNAVLNIQGYNLVDVDWRDNAQLEEWTAMHYQEHAVAASILGI
jgi:hypothetical protein